MFQKYDSDILNSLTQNELTLLRFIDANQKEVLAWSIQQLAKEAFTSTATILRLCKKLKLTGYSELKFVLKRQLDTELASENQKIPSVAVFKSLYENLEHTARFMDTKALERVVCCLLSDTRIHLYGGGFSASALEYMQRFLLSAGRNCIFYNTAPLAYRAAGKMNSQDFLLIASASGATPSVIRTAQLAKNSGACVAAISTLNHTPLSKLADINFYTFIEDRDYYGTDIKPRFSLFYIVDMILECYLYRLDSPFVVSNESSQHEVEYEN